MSETIPTTPPSDREFESFLDGLDSDSSYDLDAEMIEADVDSRLHIIIDEVGYQPLNEDNKRSYDMMDHLMAATVRAVDGDDMDNITAIAHYNMKMLALKEIVSLSIIRTTALTHEFDAASGKATPESIFKQKAQLYTDLIIRRGIDSHDVLLTVMNKLLPGDPLEPDDPRLEPYFFKSLEALANDAENSRIYAALVDDACFFIGINPLDDSFEGTKLKFAIGNLISYGKIYYDKQETAANREERLRRTAREFSLDNELTQKILEFIKSKFPIQLA